MKNFINGIKIFSNMIFSLGEIVGFVLVSVIVGYIFSDFFIFKNKNSKNKSKLLDWRSMLFAIAVTAPAVIFHELAHKFAAVSFGLNATFHAAYFWLMIGLVLKAISPGFIFFVPAYVMIQGMSTPLTQTVVSVAGPLVNLALFFIAWVVLALNLLQNKRAIIFAKLTKRINGFLFLLNMLPIPGFDGFHFFRGIYGFLR